MTLNFIDIIQTGKPVTADDWPRSSHFIVGDDHLQVGGNLPHGYTWRPRTNSDRDALVNWLQSLELPTCAGCGRDETVCSIEPCADVIADRES